MQGLTAEYATNSKTCKQKKNLQFIEFPLYRNTKTVVVPGSWHRINVKTMATAILKTFLFRLVRCLSEYVDSSPGIFCDLRFLKIVA